MHEGLKAFGAIAKLARKTAPSSATSTGQASPLRREMMEIVKLAMIEAGLKPHDPRAVGLLTILSLRSEPELREMAQLVIAVGKRLQLVVPDESGTGNGNGVTPE